MAESFSRLIALALSSLNLADAELDRGSIGRRDPATLVALGRLRRLRSVMKLVAQLAELAEEEGAKDGRDY